uniref:Ionotropic glutamate receptor C-terminal domain-containing protein n=1 Tax=Anopheles stephensi TaxID=30069 RepID=A0A182YGY2_ANOST
MKPHRDQWCPAWRQKRLFVLNYNTDPLSEDILTAILKINAPLKIISNEFSSLTYWTYENRRCALMMPSEPIYYGSRYIIFHPKLEQNLLMEDLNSSSGIILDKAYHILYNRTAIEIHHKNFFTNQTIQLDPLNIRVPNDLENLYGRTLRMSLPDGNQKVTTFDAYLGETIARHRNGSFAASTTMDTSMDYGVIHIGVPFLGSDKVMALGSTFVSVLVPRSKPKPVISVLVDPFDYYSWITLFALVFILTAVLSLFGQFLSKLNFVEVLLEMVMCILGGPSLKYGGWFENQIITNYCLLTIVIVSSYQSLIISYLSFTRYYPEINSPDEIRNSCIFPRKTAFASRLNLKTVDDVTGPVDSLCYLFNSRDNKRITTLLIENMRTIDRAASEAYKRNLRVADTIFFEFHLLYYFYNKSLIRELFPFYIHAFYESGLYDQYYKNKSSFALQYKQEVFVIKSFSVGDLSIVWFLYIGGVIQGC